MIGTLINQIIIMFILIGLGFLANKLGILHQESADDLTALLVNIISPALILNALQRPFSIKILHTILLVGLAVSIIYGLEILISHLTFSRLTNLNQRRSAIFASVYNNVGFIGIPLVSAVFGKEGVLYAVISMIIYNIFCWTHGMSLFQSKQPLSDTLRSIFLNPNVLAILLALICFFSSVTFPRIITDALTYVGNANTPLSMIIIGYTLGNLVLQKDLLNPTILRAVSYRNLLFPLMSILIFKLLGLTGMDFTASLLIAACPAPSMVVLFTLQARGDTQDAVTEVALSTALSLLTIPLVMAIGSFFS